MGVEESKTIAKRWFDEVWGRRKLEVIPELIDEDAVMYVTTSPHPYRGPADARGFVEDMLSAFPDSALQIEHLVAEGDLLAVHYSATGTHEGPFNGIEPTGRTVRTTGVAIWRVEGGKIVEEWDVVDALGMLQQLGAA